MSTSLPSDLSQMGLFVSVFYHLDSKIQSKLRSLIQSDTSESTLDPKGHGSEVIREVYRF